MNTTQNKFHLRTMSPASCLQHILHQRLSLEFDPQEGNGKQILKEGSRISDAGGTMKELWKDADSSLGSSGIKSRAFSNLGPHAAKKPRQQSFADSEDALDRSIQVSA